MTRQFVVNLDLAAAREHLVTIGETPPSDEVLLISLHKARYEMTTVAPVLRQESRGFLETRGYTRRGGIPWPPFGELPL
jgi:hypothetical protein